MLSLSFFENSKVIRDILKNFLKSDGMFIYFTIDGDAVLESFKPVLNITEKSYIVGGILPVYRIVFLVIGYLTFTLVVEVDDQDVAPLCDLLDEPKPIGFVCGYDLDEFVFFHAAFLAFHSTEHSFMNLAAAPNGFPFMGLDLIHSPMKML